MGKRVVAVVFSGGYPKTEIETEMVAIHKQMVLDKIETMKQVSELAEVLLVTSHEDLIEPARQLGARVCQDNPTVSFSFGSRLYEVTREYADDAIIYTGGVAGPLLSVSDWQWVASTLLAQEVAVMVNNPVSADIVGYTPGSLLTSIQLPSRDNFLGYLLKEAGAPRIMMPNVAQVNFDIDTSTDLLILSLQKNLGFRTRKALDDWGQNTERLLKAQKTFQEKGAEIFLAGRIGAPLIAYLNANFKVRLRLISEERGMKALGREDRGEVRSLLALLLKGMSIEEFFIFLEQTSSAAFIDTRVLFAHWQGISAADRYYSDLGLIDKIQNKKVKQFTEATLVAGIPVILGGHSLVSGGLRLLTEPLLEQTPTIPVLPGQM